MLGCLSTLYTHTCMLKCDWQCLDFNCIARSAIVRCFSHIFWLYSGLHYSAKYEISFSSKTLSSKSAPAVMHLGLYYVHVYKYRSSLCIGCFKLRPETDYKTWGVYRPPCDSLQQPKCILNFHPCMAELYIVLLLSCSQSSIALEGTMRCSVSGKQYHLRYGGCKAENKHFVQWLTFVVRMIYITL